MHQVSKSLKPLVVVVVLAATLLVGAVAMADSMQSPQLDQPTTPTLVDGPQDVNRPAPSPRLIVELESPPLAVAMSDMVSAAGVNSPAAQAHVAQLQAEQAAFMVELQSVLQDATVSTFINEQGLAEANAYQIVFNGLAIHPGSTDQAEAKALIQRMSGVKNVYDDQVYATQLYTSTALIGAPMVWNSPAMGGVENAGAGVKVASMDGGVHKDAPMFSGEDYTYPEGYGPNGLGLTSNNNGKIIVSRTYFRSWDPPLEGDVNPWPGQAGTSHGVHTASTAAGNCVDNVTYAGFDVGTMCGVAPGAYVMSYRVFYPSVNGNESFYTAEGVAALEDIVADGADVVQNSWGEGPISAGGLYDPLDMALINAGRAGVFVSMSNGNSGPNTGTSDHPSPDYINVAATTTSGTLAAGRLGISGPGEVSADMMDFPFGTADFGAPLAIGQVTTYTYKTSAAVAPANITGCSAFPENAFAGVAAVVSRGGCFFSDKVYYAEQAGATFVVIYNNAGDDLINMACGGDFCNAITAPSVFVSQTDGQKLVDWYAANGDASQFTFDAIAFQSGSTPDLVINFSSRGPGVGNTLKPDIAAPGVNILAQGYTPGVTGEDRHLGYGQASGTSMAGPHVAGAAALLRQLYPDWSVAAIKSALMSTAKYMEIYNQDGSPAQPLDMGAGRLDVAKAVDPGVILDPPSLSFGMVISGTQKTISVTVTSVADQPETYNISTLYTGNGFTQTTSLPGFSADVASVSLNPGESKVVAVTFDPAAGMGYGDNQGYILMAGDNGHHAHMPAWARVINETKVADVLIIDNDFSSELGYPDYLDYYTDALDTLGYTYSVVDTLFGAGTPATIPDATTLLGFKAVLYFTGDNFNPDGTFTVSTGLTATDQDRLVEYLNSGGVLIAMGQDLAAVLDTAVFDPPVGDRNFLYTYRLGANFVQDSVSGPTQPSGLIVPTEDAPPALANVVVDLTKPRAFEALLDLSGANEVPPVDTDTTGSATLSYDVTFNVLDVAASVAVTPTRPVTVTGMHIHAGAAGVNGGVVRSLEPMTGFFPIYVTDTLDVAITITDLITDEIEAMVAGNLYINVHTTDYPAGEVRGQIQPEVVPTQLYVDEIANRFYDGSQDPNNDGTTSESNLGSKLILRYLGGNNVYGGAVAAAHRDQPTLERPGIDYSGRSIYTTFGLEGMDEGPGVTSRADLLGAFLSWAWAEPVTLTISNTTVSNGSGLVTFSVSMAQEPVNAAGVEQSTTLISYRWDFGDGSPMVSSASNTVGHIYTCSDAGNVHTVQVEAVTDLGIHSLGAMEVDVSEFCVPAAALENLQNRLFLPQVGNGDTIPLR